MLSIADGNARYGTVVRVVVPGDTVSMGGHGDDPGPGMAASDGVYQVWRSVTGRELLPAARQEFASRAAALHLAEVDGPELAAAARRVFGVFGMLLLADWREEIDEPGVAGLRAVSGEWAGNTESATLTLRTEIAHLVESAIAARDNSGPCSGAGSGWTVTGASPWPRWVPSMACPENGSASCRYASCGSWPGGRAGVAAARCCGR